MSLLANLNLIDNNLPNLTKLKSQEFFTRSAEVNIFLLLFLFDSKYLNYDYLNSLYILKNENLEKKLKSIFDLYKPSIPLSINTVRLYVLLELLSMMLFRVIYFVTDFQPTEANYYNITDKLYNINFNEKYYTFQDKPDVYRVFTLAVNKYNSWKACHGIENDERELNSKFKSLVVSKQDLNICLKYRVIPYEFKIKDTDFIIYLPYILNSEILFMRYQIMSASVDIPKVITKKVNSEMSERSNTTFIQLVKTLQLNTLGNKDIEDYDKHMVIKYINSFGIEKIKHLLNSSDHIPYQNLFRSRNRKHFTCPICLDYKYEYTLSVDLQCSDNEFCQSCMKYLIESNDSKTLLCPYCRRSQSTLGEIFYFIYHMTKSKRNLY